MQVPIRRMDKGLPLPLYKTSGAVAMDCPVREDVEVPPNGVVMASLNIALRPPAGHFVLLVARSSLHKRGLMMANSVGIGDEDFCGDDDEYHAPLYNFTDKPVAVQRGERLVQIIILPFDRVEWQEVDTLNNPNRGAFGTTGK